MIDSLVIIPTFNEKENITAILQAVLDLGDYFDVLVVDDGSPDGTAALVNLKIQAFPGRIHLLERKGNRDWGQLILPVSNGH